jgi:hypothetical protein
MNASLSLKSISVSAFAVSVFQTQVGPRNKKLPSGFPASASPACALRIAFETAMTASSCPTTCFFKYFSSSKSFSFSVSKSFVAGIPVHLLIISAISSLVTFSLRYHFPES